MQRVLLGLGSNKTYEGHTPHQLLSLAGKELTLLLSDCRFSSVYKTPAMYVTNQENFYNMTVLGYVPDNAEPFDFLKKINAIEARYGRDRSKEIRFGPRSLDIDIELFGNYQINTENLQIPHMRIEERAFVLVPALEILTDSADELIRKKYLLCLEKLQKEGKAGGIEKLTDSYKAVENGTV